MPYGATVYKVLIASPSDVARERSAIRQAIFDWNDFHAESFKIVLLPVLWETHGRPQMGDRPQSLLNEQIVDQSDILIGAFWTRFGTPTGVADSGTVEEIRRFLDQGKPALLYFSTRAIPPARVDADQYRRLNEFKRECRQNGIIFNSDSLPKLRELLTHHLLATIRSPRVPIADG